MGDQVGNKGSETPLERVAPLATVSTLATLDALKQLQSSIMAQMQLMHTGFLDAQENPLQVPGRLPQILLLSIHSLILSPQRAILLRRKRWETPTLPLLRERKILLPLDYLELIFVKFPIIYLY
jgi:hypothetical protein